MPIGGERKYRRVIQLELNEISLEILEKLVAQGELPHFAKALKSWKRFITTSENDYEKLEPWIQWVTAHTGTSFSQHRVFRLSDADQLKERQIWEVLSDNNIESCILGCMNARKGGAKNGVFFPDPWSQNGKPYPEVLKPLYSLVASKVQKHATAPLAMKDYIRGANVLLKLWLPIYIYLLLFKELLVSKLSRNRNWRLAGAFDLLLYEIFKQFLKKGRYRFYSLFLNSVAHYQHHFWRMLEPNRFSVNVSCPDCQPSDNPILYGYKLYDRILGDLMAYKSKDTLIIVASGLSQTAFTEKEHEGGMNYYRLKDHSAFAKAVGLNAPTYPLMSRDWQVGPLDSEELLKWQERLSKVSVGGDLLFNVKNNKEGFLFLETFITRLVNDGEQICLWDGKEVGTFGELFMRIAVKSGHHVGEGLLLLSEDDQGNGFQKIPLTELYKINLKAFGVTA